MEIKANGVKFSIEELVKRKKPMTQVMDAPYGQCRDYRTFWSWPCNKQLDDYLEGIMKK